MSHPASARTRWFVSVRQEGSALFNNYPGPAPVAAAQAVARFVEVYPDRAGQVRVQVDNGVVGGPVYRGTFTLHDEEEGSDGQQG
jgi:hypothetical protein